MKCEICNQEISKLSATAVLTVRKHQHLSCHDIDLRARNRAELLAEQDAARQDAAARQAALEAAASLAQREATEAARLAAANAKASQDRIAAAAKAINDKAQAAASQSEEFKALVEARGGRVLDLEESEQAALETQANAKQAEADAEAARLATLCVHCKKNPRRGGDASAAGAKHCSACYFASQASYSPDISKTDLSKKLEDAFKPNTRNLEID